MNRIMQVLYLLWTFIFVIALLLCMVIGYFFNLTFGELWYIPVTVYGLTTLLHLFFQFIFASLNYDLVKRVVSITPRRKIPVGVQAVGHQEGEAYFRTCLHSLRSLDYEHITQIVVVSDGNTKEDQYMADVFREVMGEDGTVIEIDWIPSDLPVHERERRMQELITRSPAVCIMQPQQGKREALYTAFRILEAHGSELVLTTDSDTRIESDVINQMAPLFEQERIAAATGNVAITNVQNTLSFLSSLRYWFAFNLERAAQSYFGVVSCVSGPLGMYRMSVIEQLLDEWVHQSFLGQKSTYGDDRHLTNMVLSTGKQVVYTPFAHCYTETPTVWNRWILQQTRWSKSFYREIVINLRWFHKQPIWLAYDLVYQAIYPFFLVFSIGFQIALFITYQTTFFLIIWLSTILLGGLLRAMYAFSFTGKWKYAFFVLYGFVYILGLLPAKMIAIATLWDAQWGTSPRKNLAFDYPMHYLVVIYALLSTVLIRRLSDDLIPRMQAPAYDYVYEISDSFNNDPV